MRELHSIRFNVMHAFGFADGPRKSMVEIVILLLEPEYVAKLKLDKKQNVSGTIERTLRLETCRFCCDSSTLRETATALTEIADGLDREQELLFPNKPQSDPQKSFLNEGASPT